MAQYSIQARLVYHTSVIVEASSASEAMEKFDAKDWVGDGHSIAECVDWAGHEPTLDE